jgi:glycosyltransferase involved in cell wall biosynthesis
VKARIVIVDGSTAVTGGLRCAIRTARLLSPWVDATLVLPTGSAVSAIELAAFDHVVYLPIRSLRKTALGVAAYFPALLVAGWRLRRLLSLEGADCLILNDFTLGQGAVARALGYRGRIATWVRFDPTRFPRLLSRAWIGSGYWASDAIIAVSDFIKELLPPSPMLHRIYDSIDLDLPSQLPDLDSRDVVCVANYISGKGQDQAITAFQHVAAEFPESRLVFYGGDMDLAKNRRYLAGLKAQAAASGFGDRILFCPFTSDVAAAFETAAVALVLSSSESFGLTCLEASQLGVPVIAFRSGGPAEIVVNAVTGFLCDLGDVEGVARAMRTLLRDPAKARTMGRSGAEHVFRKFGQDEFVALTLKALKVSSNNLQGR